MRRKLPCAPCLCVLIGCDVGVVCSATLRSWNVRFMDRPLKPYRYKQFLLPSKRLPITVYVGIPDAAGYPHPYVHHRLDSADVRFPTLSVSHADVAHEGVHLVMWAIKHASESDIRRLIPGRSEYQRQSKADAKEEATARLMDRYINRFYLKAELHGLFASTEDWTRDDE